MNADILSGLKHIGVVLVIFLIAVAIALTEKNIAIVIGFTAAGVGTAFGAAALEHHKVSPKVALGWGAIGLVAGILFAAFGV